MSNHTGLLMKPVRIFLHLLAAILIIGGISLVWIHTCWQVGIGLFLMLLGSDIQHKLEATKNAYVKFMDLIDLQRARSNNNV